MKISTTLEHQLDFLGWTGFGSVFVLNIWVFFSGLAWELLFVAFGILLGFARNVVVARRLETLFQ